MANVKKLKVSELSVININVLLLDKEGINNRYHTAEIQYKKGKRRE